VIKITYIESSGTRHTIDAPAGESMMKAALNAGVEGIVGECGGNCACGTCRIYVPEEWLDRLPSIQGPEREMIDFAGDETAGVRLSCQIPVTDGLDGIEVHMPESQY